MATMTMAAAAAALRTTAGLAGGWRAAAAGGGKGGKLLIQFPRAAVRTFCSLPVGGPNQDFAVLFAFFAMKFVNRHGVNLWYLGKNSSGKRGHNVVCFCCMSHLQSAIEDSIATLRSLSALEAPLQSAAQLVGRALADGHKLLICGNGGSASDATHLATEFLCRFQQDRRPYPAISLTANGEFMTAVCNDYHADEIFARQVWGLAETGDVLIGITTSGKSRNILRALEEARRKGVASIAILGRDGGFTRGVATIDLIVPGTVTARIQEGQKVLYHALCEIVEENLPKA